MSLYPEVQQRAREELDRVIGPTRLPELSDRDQLPYVNAVLKEALRWHVPVPLSLPHMSTEEDVYQGYRIPKGTIVIPNTWCVISLYYSERSLTVYPIGPCYMTPKSFPSRSGSFPSASSRTVRSTVVLVTLPT